MKNFACFVLLLLSCHGILTQESTPIVSYNVDSDQISVAGISSGGFMAVQLGVAFSKTFSGVAVFAGGPYYCAGGSALTATGACMSNPGAISVQSLVAITASTQLYGYIDATSNMARQKVWLFSGSLDSVVQPGVVRKLKEYYGTYTKNVRTYFTTPAQHAWVTDSYGGACDRLGTPFISNCQWDAQRDFLSTFYGPDIRDRSQSIESNLVKVPQQQYLPFGYTLSTAGMADTAYLYVPTQCRAGSATKCKLVVALHGCEMTLKHIGTTFVMNSNLNGYAESNDFIVLYPQAATNALNPKGCWDWWGYTGTNYASNTGAQMVAIRNMVRSVAGLKDAATAVPLM